jgi:hypothetical protein
VQESSKQLKHANIMLSNQAWLCTSSYATKASEHKKNKKKQENEQLLVSIDQG